MGLDRLDLRLLGLRLLDLRLLGLRVGHAATMTQLLQDSETRNAVIAILLGSVVAVVLLVPTAAVQYRRDGRLGPGDLTVLLAAAIYGVALWTYTLLPTPVPGTYTCRLSQLELLGSVRPVVSAYAHRTSLTEAGLRGLLRDPAFLQLALNVLLFVPFGYFVRRVLGRGVLVAVVLGLAASLLIEATQRSGVWGLYACPYRTLDVDDLVTNTLGALVGSVGSLLLVRRRAPGALPDRVSVGRRLVGVACDVLVVVLVGGGVALAFRAYQLGVVDRPTAALDVGRLATQQSRLQWGVPLAVEAACVLLAGRTVGELVVSVHTVARRPSLVLPGRVVKLVTGVGLGIAVVGLDVPHGLVLLAAYALVSLLAVLVTREHRGLSNALAGLDLAVDRPGPD